ncbi:MAG: pyridoxamine 5'-phosphate oxidase [Phycisphaerales bacterium]|nr:pyridoxamine 5'-phosphate oxidase [Phycisphaerales bacterium]
MSKIFTPAKHSPFNKLKLEEHDLEASPIEQFLIWWDEICQSNILDPDAMSLATVNRRTLVPSQRIVYLANCDESGFVFFTNYNSRKVQEAMQIPNASLLFFWKELQRQVRIEGHLEKIAPEISDRYFNNRPHDSQISATISPQSKIIKDQAFLTARIQNFSQEHKGQTINRPHYWGGLKLIPRYFEFWQGRDARLHDRIIYQKNKKGWQIARLAP